MLIVAGIIAVVLPLVFLYVIYALDLYSSGSFRTVAICFVWGLVAFALALGLNTAADKHLLQGQLNIDRFKSYTLVVVLVAPIVEELVKSLALIYFGRRPDFTYFVDGAIYGFAAGIGFSIVENFWYISQAATASQGPLLVISRSFSTCLMHGSASALVGVSIGRFRYGRGGTRILSAILGWGAAMVLHSLFNRVVDSGEGAVLLLGAVGLGIGGMILIALFIRWGLAEEKQWIEDTLGLGLGVTGGEKALVRDLQDVDELLKPIEDRFGGEKATQVEEFLVKQAQLGIKQKSSEMTTDRRLKQQVQDQIEKLQEEVDGLRRQVGWYCMTNVRMIFPLELVAEWMGDLQRRVEEAKQRPAQFDVWGKLQSEAEARAGTESEGEP